VYRKTLQPLMKHETSNKPTDQLSQLLTCNGHIVRVECGRNATTTGQLPAENRHGNVRAM